MPEGFLKVLLSIASHPLAIAAYVCVGGRLVAVGVSASQVQRFSPRSGSDSEGAARGILPQQRLQIRPACATTRAPAPQTAYSALPPFGLHSDGSGPPPLWSGRVARFQHKQKRRHQSRANHSTSTETY